MRKPDVFQRRTPPARGDEAALGRRRSGPTRQIGIDWSAQRWSRGQRALLAFAWAPAPSAGGIQSISAGADRAPPLTGGHIQETVQWV